MRGWYVLILGCTLVVTSGCTNAILGVLVAPEGVVTGAASELARAGAETLSGASLEELSDVGGTISELDRILEENPNAVNAEHLRGLRDQLKESGANSGSKADDRQAQKEAAPRRLSDTRLPARRGDSLKLQPPGEMAIIRRPRPRPETLPMSTSLRPDPDPVHTMSLQPIRLTR